MQIQVSTYSAIPIYEQIKQQIKEKILNKEWEPLYQLPSMRQLASDLQVGIITVKRAYEDLEKEGYIFNKQGKGCFVKEVEINSLKKEMEDTLTITMKEVVSNAKLYGVSKDTLLKILGKEWNTNE